MGAGEHKTLRASMSSVYVSLRRTRLSASQDTQLTQVPLLAPTARVVQSTNGDQNKAEHGSCRKRKGHWAEITGPSHGACSIPRGAAVSRTPLSARGAGIGASSRSALCKARLGLTRSVHRVPYGRVGESRGCPRVEVVEESVHSLLSPRKKRER